jgi:large subunit ribosomal protein L24
MNKKLHVKKGDNVMVISGNEKGSRGRILMVDKKNQRAIVEGVNMVSKHQKPTNDNPQGGIVKKEAPIHISNLKVIDDSGKPSRVGRKIDEKTNKSVRYSKNTGEVIK